MLFYSDNPYTSCCYIFNSEILRKVSELGPRIFLNKTVSYLSGDYFIQSTT